MKPTQRLQELTQELIQKNPPKSTEEFTLLHIVALGKYLDEEWEKKQEVKGVQELGYLKNLVINARSVGQFGETVQRWINVYAYDEARRYALVECSGGEKMWIPELELKGHGILSDVEFRLVEAAQ